MFMLQIFNISSTLNVNDLVDYNGFDFILLIDEPSHEPIFESTSLLPFQDIFPNTTDKVNKILDDEIMATSDGGTRSQLVRWKGKARTGDAWIDANIVEQYKNISTLDSTRSSPLPLGENDADFQP